MPPVMMPTEATLAKPQKVETASANLGALRRGTEAACGSGDQMICDSNGARGFKRRGAGQTQKFYVNPMFRLRWPQRTELRPRGPGGLGRGFYLLIGVR